MICWPLRTCSPCPSMTVPIADAACRLGDGVVLCERLAETVGIEPCSLARGADGVRGTRGARRVVGLSRRSWLTERSCWCAAARMCRGWEAICCAVRRELQPRGVGLGREGGDRSVAARGWHKREGCGCGAARATRGGEGRRSAAHGWPRAGGAGTSSSASLHLFFIECHGPIAG